MLFRQGPDLPRTAAIADLPRLRCRGRVLNLHLNALYTLTEAFGGFLIAAVLGLVIGALIAQSRLVEKILYPDLITIQTTPKVAIAPLFVIWFGFGITSKIIIAATFAFFPILVNVIAGLRAIDPEKIELMRSLNASRAQIFRMAQLPNALPIIFAGLQVAVLFSILGAIVGNSSAPRLASAI